jgi:hypothetical protein
MPSKEEFFRRLSELEHAHQAETTPVVLSLSQDISTLDIHGLSPKAAVVIVSKKIKRCREMGIKQLRVVYDKKLPKLKRHLEQFLSSSEYVTDYKIEEDKRNGELQAFLLPRERTKPSQLL